MKQHKFLLVVKTMATKKAAELAILSAFSIRNPDGHEFYLRRLRKPKSRTNKPLT